MAACWLHVDLVEAARDNLGVGTGNGGGCDGAALDVAVAVTANSAAAAAGARGGGSGAASRPPSLNTRPTVTMKRDDWWCCKPAAIDQHAAHAR